MMTATSLPDQFCVCHCKYDTLRFRRALDLSPAQTVPTFSSLVLSTPTATVVDSAPGGAPNPAAALMCDPMFPARFGSVSA